MKAVAKQLRHAECVVAFKVQLLNFSDGFDYVKVKRKSSIFQRSPSRLLGYAGNGRNIFLKPLMTALNFHFLAFLVVIQTRQK